jgi:hypothetical protein
MKNNTPILMLWHVAVLCFTGVAVRVSLSKTKLNIDSGSTFHEFMDPHVMDLAATVVAPLSRV